MKLKKQYIPHDTADESLLVPTADAPFSGVVRGNKTLGVILSYLKEDTTEEEIIAAMTARFDAPEEVIARDVRKAIEELRKVGALEE
ncbi:MAG: PqqD family protein [Clostridiales bacterium]|nr:PqqD family protein [Clostridiales bacterium]MBR5974825.1 PqqD family protein [Clostridiales bacterium]